jgi:nitrogen fixation protein FixH
MKRGMGWPIAVAAILGVTIGANIWLVRVANGDPSFAVEEDYYQRGVHWDDELAQRAHNAALGWRLAASASPIRAGYGSDLRIALNDAAVAPIEGASVTVRAVHVARAGAPVDITLVSHIPGQYEARVPIERAGVWELRIDVHRGSDRFTATERLDVRAEQPW